MSRCHTCGNGKVEGIEECDGENLNGQSCQLLGAGDGELACSADCHFDQSGCEGVCGDGVRQGQEVCDGSDLGEQTCESLGQQPGTLRCTLLCAFDLEGCGGGGTCGDGVIDIDEAEVCDGDELDGESCESLGHGGGELGCAADCLAFDDSGCADAVCDNGTCENELGETVDSCPQDCGWINISAGASHTCAVKADGSTWCWGNNGNGRLGDNTIIERHMPVQICDP